MLGRLVQTLAEAVQSGPNIFVCLEPEVFDFTDPEAKTKLLLMGQGGNVAEVEITKENIFDLFGVLKVALKGMKVIAWNWKNLVSYFLGKTGHALRLEEGTVLIDLKVVELYLGIKEKAPGSLAAALGRVKAVVQGGGWKEAQKVYQGVLMPLVTTVVPALETVGILDPEKGKRLYAHYEICDQANGRLNCDGSFRDNYVPHTLSESERKRLKPRFQDEMFMYFDYRHYEVSVLAALTKDEKLNELVGREDAYTAIYETVTSIEGDSEARNKAKKMFLPVIYGAGATTLARRMSIAIPVAEQIITRIHALFPTALKWVETYQEQAKATGSAKDVFGKRRSFDKGEEYLARNFSIQAPASTISLDKLVQLHAALKGVTDVAYSVHDGYCVYASKNNWKEVFQKGYNTLTSESAMCPGLRFKVACRAGRSLDNLKPLAKAKGAQ
jgi:hypothetical protein